MVERTPVEMLIAAGADSEDPETYFDNLTGERRSDFCRDLCKVFNTAFPPSEYPNEEDLPPGVLDLFNQAWETIKPDE
jgi:hypothetical protein